MERTKDLISVIIPVYKVEQYLRECLDSVLESTHRDLEIILVDDGSPDNCGAICDEYAFRDERIIVIHQENQGLSAARNTGLSVATGKYVGFVDSDDVISPIMYEKLLWAMKKTNAEMAACEFTHNQEGLNITDEGSIDSLHIVEGYSDCLSVIFKAPITRKYTWTNCTVWNKLYLREKTSQFEVGSLFAEDLLYNYDYIKNICKMVVISRSMYFWRTNPTSITHTVTNEKYLYDAEVLQELTDKTENIDDELKEYLLGMSTYRIHNVAWKIISTGEKADYINYITRAKSRVKRYFKELMVYPDLELRVRVAAILCRFCYPLWEFAAKLYRKKST